MEKIRIVGARTHNLKNLTVEIPKNQITIVTGLSGSGKSSLAFDTIFAEGQRRYVESLSSYASQFLSDIEKPDFDYIEGLAPAIAIDQKTAARNPRSTVATATEIDVVLAAIVGGAGLMPTFKGLLAGKEGEVRSDRDKRGYVKVRVGALEVSVQSSDLEPAG